MLVARGIVDEQYKLKFGSPDSYVPDRLSGGWIVFGYLLGLWPIIGLINGLVLLNSRKTLPDGHTVKMYDKKTRQHGKVIIAISLVSTLLFVVWIFGRDRFL